MLGRQNMSLADIIRVLPGFRFRPTDEELVCFYLRRKVSGRLLPFEVIADIDLYRYEPWELPEKSALPTRDLEWYYFIPRDRKYPNGSRTNRATVKGYWKSTGKDRCVSSSARDVGTKKTLVYYNGRAPKGERTNWVMHEYRLNKEECERIHAVENGFVLCRVYKKSGLGPKNGEQYGAPVEDDDVNDAPTGWVHECSAYKADIITGIPISADAFCEEGFSPQGEDDSVSFAVDMAGQQLSYSGNEPGQQQDHFEKFGCNYQQSSAQNNTRSVTGGFTTTENGELLEPPRTQEDEAEMLRKLLEECSDQVISADYHENNIVEDGFYETGGQFPSDGDYLELNDLSSATVIGEIEMVGEGDEKVAISGLKDYEGATENYSSQVLPVFDPVGEWKNLLLDAALSDGEQGMSQDMEMQSTFATVPHDLQQQPVMENILRDFAFPPAVDNIDTERAGSMQFILPDDDGLKFSNHQNTNDYEKDRAVLGSIANSELTFFQEGAYFDAETFFPDINECGESTNATLEGSNDDNTPHVAPSHSLWPNKFNNILDDGGMNAADNDGSAQVQAVSLEQGRRTSSSLDALFKWMNSLETSPALAAELSPKKASSGGPIHITATGIAMGTLSVTCTCIGEGVPSSCVSCSVTEVEKKAPFVRSVTLVGQVQKLLNKCNMGIFWGIFATLIWVLVGAGAWKAWGFVSSLVSWSKF